MKSTTTTTTQTKDLDKFKPKAAKDKTNLIILIITLIFAALGLVCLFIGLYTDVVKWFKTFGIVLLATAFPVSIWIISKIVVKKIKEM